MLDTPRKRDILSHETKKRGGETKMAVTTTLDKIAVRMNLNNGTDPSTGQIKTVSQNLGTLNPETYDAQKVMNIVEGLVPCLTKSVYSVQEVRTSTLTD